MPLRKDKRSLAALTLVSALSLSSCIGGGERPAPRAVQAPPVELVTDGPPRIGDTYTINGQSYTPADVVDYDEVGYASWYGGELEGQTTANGEAFRASWVSAAHRTLPLPSYVEVTRLDTGKTILVRINDRGPADPNRLIDLSAGAAEQLGIASGGVVAVRVRRTNPVESERAALRSGREVPQRLDTPGSLLEVLRERVARLPVPRGAAAAVAATPVPASTVAAVEASPIQASTPTQAPSPAVTAVATPPRVAVPAGQGGYIVQVGACASRARADALAQRLGATVSPQGNLHRVRYGPFASEAEARAAVQRARAAGQPGAVIVRER